MTTLPEPSFIERAPATIEQQAKSTFEAALGKPLFPGQAEQLALNGLVYRELLVRIGVQNAALQNLVNYATGINLDQLGELLATKRLEATAATVTIKFSISNPLAANLAIPAGTRVAASGSPIRFALNAGAVIAAGQTSTTGLSTASTKGVTGNGFEVGQITTLVDAVPGATVSVTNTEISKDGFAGEADERYRARVKLAPNRFSVAGSEGAYRFYALSADASITDVAIASNPPTLTVNVYPLTKTGLPSTAILDAVRSTLNQDTVRPLTDIVNVARPTEVNYNITASVTLYSTADTPTLEARLQTAAQAYADEQAARLGRDIVRSQISAALSIEGVYSISLTAPANDLVVAANEWANVGIITITIAGVANG